MPTFKDQAEAHAYYEERKARNKIVGYTKTPAALAKIAAKEQAAKERSTALEAKREDRMRERLEKEQAFRDRFKRTPEQDAALKREYLEQQKRPGFADALPAKKPADKPLRSDFRRKMFRARM